MTHRITIPRMMILLVFLVLSCQNNSTSSTDEKKEVNIIYSNWSEGIAVSFLVKNVLEEELDYEVHLKLADIENAYRQLASGDYDLMLDAWLPETHEIYYQKHRHNLTDAGVFFKGAFIGLVVPQESGIAEIADINRYTDTIYGIGSSAGIMLRTEKILGQYDLQTTLLSGDEQQMLQVLDSLYKRREPVVITGWKPHSMFKKYDLKFLRDPKGIYPESDNIHALVNQEFSRKDQILMDFLARFSLSSRQLSDLMQEVRTHPEGEDAGARAWMKTNTTMVAAWTRNLREFKQKPL